jgi:hypothetical protein
VGAGGHARVLEEVDEVGFGRLLQCKDRGALPAEADLVVPLGGHLERDLAHDARERELAEQQVCALLVLADLAQRDRARAEPLLSAAVVRGRGRAGCTPR